MLVVFVDHGSWASATDGDASAATDRQCGYERLQLPAVWQCVTLSGASGDSVTLSGASDSYVKFVDSD